MIRKRNTGGFVGSSGIYATTPTSNGLAQVFNTQGLANQYLAGQAEEQSAEAQKAAQRKKATEDIYKSLSGIDKNTVWMRDMPLLQKATQDYDKFIYDAILTKGPESVMSDPMFQLEKKRKEGEMLQLVRNSKDQQDLYSKYAGDVLNDKEDRFDDSTHQYLSEFSKTPGAAFDESKIKLKEKPFDVYKNFQENVLPTFGHLTKDGRIAIENPNGGVSTIDTKDLPLDKIYQQLENNYSLSPQVKKGVDNAFLNLPAGDQGGYQSSLDWYKKTVGSPFEKHEALKSLTKGDKQGYGFSNGVYSNNKFSFVLDQGSPYMKDAATGTGLKTPVQKTIDIARTDAGRNKPLNIPTDGAIDANTGKPIKLDKSQIEPVRLVQANDEWFMEGVQTKTVAHADGTTQDVEEKRVLVPYGKAKNVLKAEFDGFDLDSFLKTADPGATYQSSGNSGKSLNPKATKQAVASKLGSIFGKK